jgi:multidrug resistance efflux pump
MAESEFQFAQSIKEIALPKPQFGRRLRPVVLMMTVPLLLVGGAVWYNRSTEHIVPTDNSYLQRDKVSVNPQGAGEIFEVPAHENQHVNDIDASK